MKIVLFMLFALMPVSLFAQVPPTKCWQPYQYVYSYEQWYLENGVWHLPFVCTSGYQASVQINENNVQNEGYAEYTIQAKGFDNDNTFFFTEPCGAMGQFCQFQVMPQEKDAPEVYSLDE